jgi:hypothetical protein
MNDELSRRRQLLVDPDQTLLPGCQYKTAAQQRFIESPPEIQRLIRAEAQKAIDAAIAVEQQRKDANRKFVDEQRRRFRAEDDRLRRLLLTRQRRDALGTHVETLARRHGVQVIFHPTNPEPVRKFRARVKQRQVHTEIFRTTSLEADLDYAATCHEFGHIIEGLCSNRQHFHDASNTHQFACLLCEVNAWRCALRIALTWTPGMHAEMRRCLESYRRCTPATAEALRAMDSICSDETLKHEQARHRLGMDHYDYRLHRAGVRHQ